MSPAMLIVKRRVWLIGESHFFFHVSCDHQAMRRSACAAAPVAGPEDCRWVAAFISIGKRSGHTSSPLREGGTLRGKGPTGSPAGRPPVLRVAGSAVDAVVIRASITDVRPSSAVRVPATRRLLSVHDPGHDASGQYTMVYGSSQAGSR